MSVGTLAREARRPWTVPEARRARALITPAAAAVAALTALAAILRFARIGHQGFWFDEGNTALLLHLSPGKMLGLIPQQESTPPLYYCVAWVWARIFGYGEAGLRSLSAVAGVATVPVAYAAASKLISRRAGLVAAALTACSPFLIWYSQEARSYSLLVLLTGASLLMFVYARANPTPRTLLAWVLAAALSLATHYYAILAVVPQAVWLLATHRRKRPVQLAVAVVVACGLALIPLAISQQGTGLSSWIAPVSLSLRLGQVAQHFLVGTGAPAALALKLIAGACILLAFALLFDRGEVSERRGAVVAGSLALGGLALILVMVAVGVDDLITRNVIALWLPALFVVGAGLGARRAGAGGLAGAATLCAVGIVAAVGVAVDRNLQRPDWRPVARALGPRPASGAPGKAILLQHYRTLLPLSLYMPGLEAVHGGAVLVNELDVLSIRSPGDPFCWWGAACNLLNSSLPARLPIRGFHVSGPVEHIHQFSLLRLRAPRPVLLTPSMVSRALTTSTLPRDELLLERPA